VDAAIAECGTLIGQAQDLAGEANVNAFLGGLVAMRGQFDRACALVADARLLFDDLGQSSAVARTCCPLEAAVAFLKGDPAAAERVLRESCALLVRMHEGSSLGTQMAELGEALYRQGKTDEAEDWVRKADENAASDDVDAQIPLQGVRAKLLARRGQSAHAEELARSAIGLAERTDALNRRARARLDFADVLGRGGRLDESHAAAEEAARLFDLKGNTVEAARARAFFREEVTA
jgi:tetratricopeptide (TPR) repeat protein